MDVDPLSRQVGRGNVTGLFGYHHYCSTGAHDSFVPGDQAPHHLEGFRGVCVIGNRRNLCEFAVSERSEMTKRPDPLGNLVDCVPDLEVLIFEHRVQRTEQ